MADNRGYFRLEVKMKNRHKHSAVACASYRSDEKLYSERDGLYKSFRKHEVAPETFILKPENAPSWVLDRERLWNEVEKIENKPKSQLAREVLLSIPKELKEQEQTKLIHDFVQEQFVNSGMVADVSIHRNDKNNPHAHVLLTTRSFDKNGNWEAKSKRVQKVDESGNLVFNEKGQRVTKSVKTNDWDSKETLLKWRENWALALNNAMEKNGLDLSFSHKSFEEQGYDKLPAIRLSRSEYYLEKQAKEEAKRTGAVYVPVTENGKQNQLIDEYNQLLLDEKATIEQIKESQNKVRITNPEQQRAINFVVEFNDKYPLSEREKTAYQSIKKRAKEDINFAVARKMFIDVSEGYFKRKIDVMNLKLEAKKDYISNVLKPEFAKDKGYNFSINTNLSPLEFNAYVTKNVNEFNEMNNELNKLKQAHANLLEDAKIVLMRETKKVNEVFDFIYHDNIVNDKFTSPTLRYSASKSFLDDGIKARVYDNYKGQENVEKHYNKLARTKSSKEKFEEINNDMIKNLYAYRLFDRNINYWIKYEDSLAKGLNEITVPTKGTHLSNLEKRELARNLVLMYRDQLDDLLPQVKEKYNLNDSFSLKDTVEILTGDEVELLNLYGDKDKIFENEYDSQANKYKLLNNEQYNQFNDMNNPHVNGLANSLLDGLFKADKDNNYYKNNKKKRKIKGKYRTIEDHEPEL